jgi:hypothetical protein
VVFGHVIFGQELISQIESSETDAKNRPVSDVKVENCGELVPQMKSKGLYCLPFNLWLSDYPFDIFKLFLNEETQYFLSLEIIVLKFQC